MAKASATASPASRRVFYTKHQDIELPNLIDHQIRSFNWFVEEGLGELLAEISPIEDYTGQKLTLSFKSCYFDEPKMTEIEAR